MGEQPTGTVTLLFTDIERSTQLLERLGPERYAESLDMHRRLLREAFERYGGYEVDCEGDSFFVAFASAGEALAAAAAAQRALAAATWPDGGPIRVRIGIHTGEPQPVRPKYVGLDVHRAARVMQAAYGGQVLVSASTAELVSGHPPEELTLRDLGEHRLKDLATAQRLYQLVGGGLPQDFPSPRTLENRPTNLPTQPTAFLGRELELAELVGLLARPDVRLLTLTGPGGTGKTRLALQLAAELVDRYPQGVYLVTLAPVSDPELVLPTIAQTLGFREEGGEPLSAVVERSLREREILLLLDNFEHLESAAPVVAELLSAAPGLNVLATSRAPLHLAAEREYQVAPLEEVQALELFAERARAVLPGFVLNGNRAAVVEICRRLDHLPLAVELAAARVKLLPPPALLDRLEQRLKLLTGGARDLDERQRTLRAAIDWSYDLLSEDERVLFRRLAVFAGGWTLEAAEAVCGGDAELDIIDGLASLLDKSLIRQTGADEPRYSMLQTIREYALELLEASGEANDLRRRHAEVFATLSDERPLRNRLDVEVLDRFESELENMRAALVESRRGDVAMDVAMELRIAVAIGWFSSYRGNAAEGRRALVAAVARADGIPNVGLYADALDRLGWLQYRQGRADEARASIEEALSLARELGDTYRTTNLLSLLGFLLRAGGDLVGARALNEEGLELARTAGDRAAEYQATSVLGDLALYEGDFQRARSYCEQARALAVELSDRLSAGHSLWNVAAANLHDGHVETAEQQFADALATFREHGWLEGIAYGLEGLAATAARKGEAERGAQLFGAAGALLEDAGMKFEPFEQAMHDRTDALLREALGDERFRALVDEGSELGVDVAEVRQAG